jgi:hypothetical protein
MQRSSEWAALTALCALLLMHCGGRALTSDSSSPPTDDVDSANSGASEDAGSAGASDDADCPPPPCAGTGNVDPTWIHTGCGSGDLILNRNGKPVKVCHHIK